MRVGRVTKKAKISKGGVDDKRDGDRFVSVSRKRRRCIVRWDRVEVERLGSGESIERLSR